MRLLSCQDLSEPGVGQLSVIPGSHNSKMALPSDLDGQDYLPIAQELCAKPGTAILSATLFATAVLSCPVLSGSRLPGSGKRW